MCATPTMAERHATETELLARAVTDDRNAASAILAQLGSDNKWLQQMMMEAIGQCVDPRLWRRLLNRMALHRWGDDANYRCRPDSATSKRIDEAIIRLFVSDDVSEATPVKLAVLDEGMNDPECRVRSAAAILRGLRGDPRAVGELAETVRSGDVECKLRAIAALGKLNDELAGWALIEALASDDEKVHHDAGRALSELGERAIPALTDALKHPHQHVRWHAVRALGDIGGARSVTSLLEALADGDFSVCWAAAEALAVIGEPAVPKILQWLSHHTLLDNVRQAAYHALHQMPSRRVQVRLQPLLDALRGPAAAVEAPTAAYRLLQTWEDQS